MGSVEQSLRLFVLLWLALAWPSAYAQTPNIKHTTLFDGLPQTQVQAMVQDRDGYIWIGSYGGVARFNGREFESTTAMQGLPSNTVIALDLDRRGRLLLGIIGEACVMNDGQVACTDMRQYLPEARVAAFLQTDAGLWVATTEGIVLLDAPAGELVRTFTEQDGLPSGAIAHLAVDSAGTIWAGGDGGLSRMVGDRFEPSAPEVGAVSALVRVDEGLVVAFERKRLWVLADGRFTPRPAPEGMTGDLFEHAAVDGGGIWFASPSALVRYHRGSFELLNTDRRFGPGVHASMVDHEGSVWVGSDIGISRYIPGRFSGYTEVDGLPHPTVRSIAEDDQGRVWLGTRNGLARIEDRVISVMIPGAELPDPGVFAVSPTSDQRVLVGTPKGMVVYDDDTQEHTVLTPEQGLPHEMVLSFGPRKAGGFWVGTRSGIAVWDDGELTAFEAEHPLGTLFAISLATDSRGRLWVGQALGGVVIWDGIQATPLGEEEGLSDDVIWAMHAEGDAMWVGTNGDGAFRVDPSGIQVLSTDVGMKNNFVWQVLPDEAGGVWLYTNQGLDHYDGQRFTHYGAGDGLIDLEGYANAALRDREGTLWFGVGRGLLEYRADKQVPDELPPRIVIERVTGLDGPMGNGTMLEPGKASVTVDFAALTFRAPDTVKYRHRLVVDGEVGPWSEPASLSQVKYSNLPYATYEIHGSAVLESGLASDTPARFSFGVAPWFWQTLWFRLTLFGMGGSLAAGFAFLRVSRTRVERDRLMELVAERTSQLRSQNTTLILEIGQRETAEREREALMHQLHQARRVEALGRLAGGIAHDFNNLLTAITLNVMVARVELPDTESSTSILDEIDHATKRAASLVAQLLAFGRKQMVIPKPMSVNDTVQKARVMLAHIIGSNIEVVYSLHRGPTVVVADSGQVEQVLINLVANARDAMPTGGAISVTTCIEPKLLPDASGVADHVVIEVVDTGEGMDDDTLDQIFEPFFTTKKAGDGTGLGMASVLGVVQQNGGQIAVRSRLGVGTAVTVYLPLVGSAPHVEVTPVPAQTPSPTGRTLLVIDDEPLLLRVLCRILRSAGYKVIEATDGKNAVMVADRYPGHIDLLVCDVIMPVMSGPRAVEQIKIKRLGVPVLFMSGHTGDHLGEQGLLPIGTKLLTKPFDASLVLEQVGAALASAQLTT